MRTVYCIASRSQGSASPLLTVALERSGEILIALNSPVLRQLNERDAKDIAERIEAEILKQARPNLRGPAMRAGSSL